MGINQNTVGTADQALSIEQFPCLQRSGLLGNNLSLIVQQLVLTGVQSKIGKAADLPLTIVQLLRRNDQIVIRHDFTETVSDGIIDR